MLVVRMLGVGKTLWVVRIIEVVRLEWWEGGLWGCWEFRNDQNELGVENDGDVENKGGDDNP